MIVLEGADGVGKTTLANQLVHELNQRFGKDAYYTYRHLGMPTEYYRQHRHELLKNMVDEYTICDRHWLSSYVYDRVAGYEVSLQYYRGLWLSLRRRGVKTIILAASDATIEKRYHDKQDFSLSDVLKANQLYKEAFLLFQDMYLISCYGQSYIIRHHSLTKQVRHQGLMDFLCEL